VARLEGGGKGDLAVELRVVIPTGLSDEQERLLKEFASSGGDRAGDASVIDSQPGSGDKESFWSKLSGGGKKKKKK
jgi:DnaJ-class molecular chaperone